MLKAVAVMPTRGRSRQVWAQQAIDCFLVQDYPEKQLIILDDAMDRTFDRDVRLDGVWYAAVDSASIPVKRNQICTLACTLGADIICHFDSDDWSAPNRMTDQVYRLIESRKGVTGYHGMFFYEEETGRRFKYWNAGYAIGTSLCFTRAYWEQHPFPTFRLLGSDDRFQHKAAEFHELVTADGTDKMVARIHKGNTNPKRLTNPRLKENKLEPLPEGFVRQAGLSIGV